MGRDTVCRVEERKSMKQMPAIEFIDKVFNPFEKIEKLNDLLTKLEELSPKIEQLLKLVEPLGYHHDAFPIYLRQEINSHQDGHKGEPSRGVADNYFPSVRKGGKPICQQKIKMENK